MNGRLKLLREEKGLTQKELADILKLSASSIAMYESGKRDPDTSTIKSLAVLFNCSTDFLLGLSNYRDVSKLRMVRVESGLSQDEVAKNLGISRDTLSKYETGELEPNVDTLVKLANMYHVSLDYLVGKTNERVSLDNDKPSEFERRFNSLGPEEQRDLEKYMDLLEIKTKMDSNDKKTNCSTSDK